MTVFFMRSSRRRQCDDVVRIASETGDDFAGGEAPQCAPGRIVNTGRHGVCLQTDHALEPGSSIEIVHPGEQTRDTVYKVRRGRVIWCRKIEAGSGRLFGAGILIKERVMQAEIPAASLV